MINANAINPNELPSVLLSRRKALPDCPAVYFVLTATGQVLYIGRSESLFFRIKSHHRRFQFKRLQSVRVAWLETSLESLTELESACIAIFNPTLNRTPVPLVEGQLQLVAGFVPPPVKQLIKELAEKDGRSESQALRKLLERLPEVKAALRRAKAA